MILYPFHEMLLMIACAIAVDWLVGDPKWPTHPVIWIGRWIATMERMLRSSGSDESPAALRFKGVILTAATTTVSFAVMLGIVMLGKWVHPWLGYALNVWFISSTIAVKGLKDAAMLVYRPLMAGNLADARKYTGHIVGRDTDKLDEGEASRAVVETVAENTVDAVVSPLFFALLGGAPLAMLYRAANTLDSMVGYRSERYLHFGWCSARFDDLLNYVPARITGMLLAVASVPAKGLSPMRAVRSMLAFAGRHPSPNSGWPESAAAGALGIELGGVNSYFGQLSKRARMGWKVRGIEAQDIVRTVTLLYAVSVMLFIMGVAGWLVLR